MRRETIPASLILPALLLLGGTAAAQNSAEIAPAAFPAVTSEDSVEFLQAARSDQASFERLRRRRLPETWGGGSARCDERVGRFCLTHGTGSDDWHAPPEDEEVIAARLRLIDGLSEVAALIPGDGWIAGQRVRYLVEAEKMELALVAAQECRAEVWWCAALEGFVHHYSGSPALADSAFMTALAAMDEAERERWNDLSLILDERTVRTYRRLEEEEQAAFERRFWRLADPLLTRPGNELRSEHLARHVWDQFQYRAQSADGISWGYDLREILIRYGWPSGWEQTREWGMATGPAPLISHYSSSPQYLLPPSAALLEEDGTDGLWEQELPRARTGYNLPSGDSVAKWFSPLAHQVAVFHRADSAIVVAAYDLPADSLSENPEITAGLSLLPTVRPNAEPLVATIERATLSAAGMIATPAEPVIMALEVMVPEERRLARVRYGLDLAPVPPGLLSLSSLLLLRDSEPLPESLEAAVEQARGSTQVRSGEEIGLYWEIYGVDPMITPALTVSLRMLEGRKGWLRRLAESAGLLREVEPIRLRWQEGVSQGPVLPRSLAVQIPPIEPGTYTLELSVQAPGREPLSVRKDIEVVGS